jgi:sarcosine/dimethylglycine N-methyltransferase
MTDEKLAAEAKADPDAIDDSYGEELLRCMDLLEREDFYGIAAWAGVPYFAAKLGLTPESHVLDIGSGIGGPARWLARSYGCKVTAIDLSEFNHRTALERTRQAGLEHLVTCVRGDMFDMAFPDASFTHVFGSEALCYSSDKGRLYEGARRVLVPGGVIAFLEAACEAPLRLCAEEHLGPVRYESVARYATLLQAAGFEDVRPYDTTEFAAKDVAESLLRLITRRERVIESVGPEVYTALLEIWAEFLAHFSEGQLTHCGISARRTPSPR